VHEVLSGELSGLVCEGLAYSSSSCRGRCSSGGQRASDLGDMRFKQTSAKKATDLLYSISMQDGDENDEQRIT
jgi:hypothetical protein